MFGRSRFGRFRKALAGRLFDRLYHQNQIGIQGTSHLLTSLAGAVRHLFRANRAYTPPNRVNVHLDIVASDCLDGAGNFREKAEQRATRGLLEAALAFDGSINANFADLVSDY